MSEQIVNLPAGQRFAKIVSVRQEQEDEDKALRLEFSFSSEEPVPRFSWERFEPINEVLDHSDEGSANFERLNDGAPLLFNHDFDAHIGVVEKAWVDTRARKAYAVVRFGDNDLAEQKKKDVLSGILRNVSFMYAVHALSLEREAEGELPTYRATDWEAFEVSLVTVPADNSVGLGRMRDLPEKQFPARVTGRSLAETAPNSQTAERSATTKEEEDVSDQHTPEPAETPAVDESKIRAEVGADFQARARKLLQVAEDNGMADLGRQAVSEGKDQMWLLERINERHREGFQPVDTSIDMSDKEKRQYSVMKALRARFYGEGEAGLEREAHDEVARKIGREDWQSGKRSVLIPLDVQNQLRTQQTGNLGDGGALVQTEYGSFVDALRHETILGQLGANFISGLEGDFEQSRKTSNSTAYWVAEGENVSKSTMGYGTLKGHPHTLGARVHFTRRQIQQSSIDVEMDGRRDIADSVTIEVDRVGFHGSGANGEPLGIFNTNGIGSVSGSSISRSDLLEHEENVRAAKVRLETPKQWVSSVDVKRFLRDAKVDSGSGLFLWRDDNRMIGYPAMDHTNLDDGYLLFGAFQYLSILDWGVMEIDEDPYTDHAAGGLYLRVLRDVDFIVRQLGAFSMQSGITSAA